MSIVASGGDGLNFGFLFEVLQQLRLDVVYSAIVVNIWQHIFNHLQFG